MQRPRHRDVNALYATEIQRTPIIVLDPEVSVLRFVPTVRLLAKAPVRGARALFSGDYQTG